MKSIDEKITTSEKFAKEVSETFKALYPFNKFINEGINYHLSIDK